MTSSVTGKTPDGHDELLVQLRDLVPSAFLDGELDREALLDALGLGDDAKPAFAFTWPGIDRARQNARAATSATLVPDDDASLSWEGARDVLIEGDNLQVLKLLKNGYSRKVKLIYIDPPYNTGDTFTYSDDFAVPESQYLADTGQVDEQGNATTSRIETGGRKHAPWLTMMFPRLALARHLLRRDGVILVSIDDNEVHHLRLLLDSVFGTENFVGNFVWNGGRKNDARQISVGHDYVLAYARDYAYLREQDARWRERKSGLDQIYAKVTELRGKHGSDYSSSHSALLSWFRALPEEHPSKSHEHFNYVDDRGVYFPDNLRSPNPRPNLVYDFKGYKPHENGWAYSRERMEKLDAEGRIYYPERTDQRLKIKSYLHEHEEWAPGSVFYRDRRAASKALDKLMGTTVFDYPKSTDVLARLFHAITNDGDLILDFFAGSGSTGHAVWEQNPRDGKTRHWILVQVPEQPDSSEASGKNALEAGYETIFEITAERLRRAAKALQEDTTNAPDLGFRIFRTRPTNLIVEKPIEATPELTGQTYLAQVLDHTEGAPVVDGANPIDVAWEVALKATGTRLDARVVTHDLDGVTVYEFVPSEPDDAHGRLLISLDAFTLAAADALSLSDNDTLILRGDKVEDSVTLTLAPRLQSKLVLLERVPREVSL
ncbi:adenine-specific DNA-methyltransferase [Streptomyces sp. BpilaLS-43]|uniref:site-specific DNA-methyltransferase n=1 Tax=Streptomyces sp. BpilaLS-43 TaxID=1839778 RepID=UPI00081B8D51|nr:site-specific DNA-methyltransferase [Streptomyces sp. BpilaLS-43]SCD35809.1 adenine-specific DNA-methyltransferase [Streptomyces sp. BpilaLS-43]